MAVGAVAPGVVIANALRVDPKQYRKVLGKTVDPAAALACGFMTDGVFCNIPSYYMAHAEAPPLNAKEGDIWQDPVAGHWYVCESVVRPEKSFQLIQTWGPMHFRLD